MSLADLKILRIKLEETIRQHLSPQAFTWLKAEAESARDIRRFNTAFVIMPRKTGKTVVVTSPEVEAGLRQSRPGFTITGWTIDRLCRVWLIMHLEQGPGYNQVIENLFLNAEMNELIALYSALPVLAEPESWRKRCAEGIRNNIAQVLEVVMCNNPYPAEQLDEAAWNQLVLKAIFTDKPLLQIYGIRDRANKSLAESISSFAHERWAAGRQVNPLVWICVTRFVDAMLLKDVERLAFSTDTLERKAAALICNESSDNGAKRLLKSIPELQTLISQDNISWEKLELDLNQRQQ